MLASIPAKYLRSLSQATNCNFDTRPKVLGIGGFGIVLQGTYVGTKASQPVAIKIAKPAASSEGASSHLEAMHNALRTEIRALKRLSPAHNPHPHIVALVRDNEEEGKQDIPVLVMELCRSGTLLHHVAWDTLPLGRVEALHHICVGLAFMHDHGIYHCDLKPANILIQYSSRTGYVCKIADFGIARARLHDRRYEGTPLYFPPEADLGRSVSAAMCDVFAVGIIFHVVLTACLPWTDCHVKAPIVKWRLWRGNVEDIFVSFFDATWAYESRYRETASQLEERARDLLLADEQCTL